jgi:hypothetical protein
MLEIRKGGYFEEHRKLKSELLCNFSANRNQWISIKTSFEVEFLYLNGCLVGILLKGVVKGLRARRSLSQILQMCSPRKHGL